MNVSATDIRARAEALAGAKLEDVPAPERSALIVRTADALGVSRRLVLDAVVAVWAGQVVYDAPSPAEALAKTNAGGSHAGGKQSFGATPFGVFLSGRTSGVAGPDRPLQTLDAAPPQIAQHFAHEGIRGDYYRTYVELDPTQVDPLLFEILDHRKSIAAQYGLDGDAVIFSGSWSVSTALSLPVPAKQGAPAEINTLYPPHLDTADTFRLAFEAPWERDGYRVEMYGETDRNLVYLAQNADAGRHAIAGNPTLNVPFKHQLFGVVDRDDAGKPRVRLLFKTPADAESYQRRELAIPDPRGYAPGSEDPAAWARGFLDANGNPFGCLAYNLTIGGRALGVDDRWHHDADTLAFLRALVGQMSSEEVADAIAHARRDVGGEPASARALEALLPRIVDVPR